MSLVKDINVGDQISHYGSFAKVTAKELVDGKVKLTVQEDGAVATRIEDLKTNLPVLGSLGE